MSSLIEVRVPDMGNFESVAVIDVLVKPGDTIEVDARNIVYASLHALAEEGALDKGTLKAALNKLGLDANKMDPQKA